MPDPMSRYDRGTWPCRSLPVCMFSGLFMILVVFMLGQAESDADLWGHLRFGQDMLASGGVTRQDSYSFTSDRPWVNHEWLAEVLTAAAFQQWGNWGLLLLSGAAALISLALVRSSVRHAGVGEPLQFVLLGVAFLAMFWQLVSFRPQLFSVPLFALELWALSRAEKGNPVALLLLPAAFALWANLHGGWIVGMGTLGLWALTSAIRGSVPVGWLAGSFTLAAVSTLLNPYALGLWEFLAQTVRLGRADIQEWQPLWRMPGHFVMWFASAATVWCAWRHRGELGRAAFLLPVALGIAAFKVARIEPYFALTAAVMLAERFRNVGPRQFPMSGRPSTASWAIAGALFLTALTVTGRSVVAVASCLPLGSAPDAEPMLFLRMNGLRGRLLTWFDYGEYAIWHLSPGLKVSYDGRRETVYSEGVQQAHLRFYFGQGDVSYARAIEADYLWLPNRLPVVPRLPADGWVPVFRGRLSTVFARERLSLGQPAWVTGERCFPGP